ncbi:WD40 repeat domain-containing serine/threonine protein kinase [Streptomyces sp. N35]|uniref:WD40 repeat domain-containing serine/threonine protein kinase n=1 Tax=Streptomyces sp. N35 TaxID=2795730 RepID=UPI0018F37AD3|nr:protein kinase [Streptomyces sp. N35]
MQGRWLEPYVVDGQYEVWMVHEQGGMGLVHRVKHLEWGVMLAMKSPRPELLAGAGFLDRFVAEAETWVSLGLHPHVCGCHYVRTIDGIPRVFSEYVSGGSVADWIRDGRLHEGRPAEALARIVDFAIQVAWGLDYAHSRGLVHQDVKPGNVLVDLDDTVKVTDFGLARALASTAASTQPDAEQDERSLLVTHAGLTLAYASPEQAAGERVSRRTDVYSFGVLVLEMFTGEVTWLAGPAAGEALAEYRADNEDGPPMPYGIGALLARCLRRDPARRPASLADVADVLTGLYEDMTGTPYPRARPAGADLRADELNNRALSLLDLGRTADAEEAFEAALAADPRHLVATYNHGLHQWRQGKLLDDEFVASLESLRADTATDAWQARHLLAQVHLERADHRSVEPLLEEMDSARPRTEEAAALRTALGAGQGTTDRSQPLPWKEIWKGRPGQVRLYPDGSWALAGGPGGLVQLWHLPTGEVHRTLTGHDTDIVAVDATSRRAVTADAGGVVRQWDLPEDRRLGVKRLPQVSEVRLTPDARTVVALAGAGLTAWGFPDGQPYVLTSQEGITAFDVSNDRALTLTGHDTVQAWDLDSRSLLWTMPAHRHQVDTVALSRDGRRAVVAAINSPRRHELKVWDIDQSREIATMTAPGWTVTRLVLSPDGRYALSGVEDESRIRLWDLDRGRCLRTFEGHNTRFGELRLRLGDRAATIMDMDNARWLQWDPPGTFTATPVLARPRRQADLDRHGRWSAALLAGAEKALAAGRTSVAVDLVQRARAVPGHASDPRALELWRVLGAETVRCGVRSVRAAWELTDIQSVGSVAISPDGVKVCASGGGQVRLWDTTTGVQLATWKDDGTGAVALLSDGRRVVASGQRRIVMRSAPHGHWPVVLNTDPSDGLRGRRGTGATGDRGTASVSADGLVLTACLDGELRLWDLTAVDLVRTLPGGQSNSVWLSADARRAVSAGFDGTLHIWDMESGTEVTAAHPGVWVTSVCLSADGRIVLSAGQHGDWTLWVTDAATGEFVRGLSKERDDEDVVWTVRLSSDGLFAFSGDEEGDVRIWEIATGRHIRTLEGHTGRVNGLALTPDDRYLLSGSEDGSVRLWELDWELTAAR